VSVTSPPTPRGAPRGHLTRGRRASWGRVLALGTVGALGVVGASLAVTELRLRRAERAAPTAVTAPPPGSRRLPPPTRERVPLMLVHEETCYVGYAPRTEQFILRDGTPLRHRHINDAEGFRVDDPAAPRPGACRVLAVGDSFTAGLYVDAARAWPGALEARLRAKGYSVRVDNGGLQGHTITQERAEVLSRWASLRPRIVVVGRTSNDVTDVLSLQRAGCRVGGAPPATFTPALPDVAVDLRLVAGALEARARLRGMTDRLIATLRGGQVDLDAPRCAAAAEAYVQEAQDLARGAARAGARVLFAAFEQPWCGEGPNLLNAASFESRVTAVAAAEGARVVDLSGLLHAPSARLQPWDNHPSPAGHEDLAAGIAADLIASGWLEACR
jgi:lysophospholipase L1-like esterase